MLRRPVEPTAQSRQRKADIHRKADVRKPSHKQTHSPQQTAPLFNYLVGSSQGTARCCMRRKMCCGWARPALFSRAWDDDLKAKSGARWRTFRSAEDNAVNPPLDCRMARTKVVRMRRPKLGRVGSPSGRRRAARLVVIEQALQQRRVSVFATCRRSGATLRTLRGRRAQTMYRPIRSTSIHTRQR